MKMKFIVAAILTLFVISCSKRNDFFLRQLKNIIFGEREEGVFFSDTVASISNNICVLPDGPPQTHISAQHDIGGE